MAKKASKKSPAKKKIQVKKPAKKAAARKASRPAASKATTPSRPKWRPDFVHDITANLVLRDTKAAIEFYKRALGAEQLMVFEAPGGGVMHAEIRIGDSVIAMNDDMPGPGPKVTTAAGPNHKPTANFMLYTPDCDALYNRAIAAGAQSFMPVMDMFWGDRMGGITDPFGQVWMISTHQKDLSPEEMKKAGDEAMKQMMSQPPPGAGGQTPPTAMSQP
jgi:uncharacterized glyoxalase superfamily protein PhnB